MPSRTLAASGLLALLCGACFVDNPGESSSGNAGDPPATTGQGTGQTTGQTSDAATTTGVLPVSTVTGEASQTGDSTATTTGDDTTGGPTTGPGPVCPAAADFPGLGDDACRACMATSCCAPVGSCGEDPACVGAWGCEAAEPCPGEWAACPGHAEHKDRTDAISTCMSGPCAGACPQVVCGPEKAECTANPACGQVNDCVAAQCEGVCPPDDADCSLACWDMCAQMHPGGGEDWSALLICYGGQCP